MHSQCTEFLQAIRANMTTLVERFLISIITDGLIFGVWGCAFFMGQNVHLSAAIFPHVFVTVHRNGQVDNVCSMYMLLGAFHPHGGKTSQVERMKCCRPKINAKHTSLYWLPAPLVHGFSGSGFIMPCFWRSHNPGRNTASKRVWQR